MCIRDRANSVLPLAVGPIKIITWGRYKDIWISDEKNISYIIKVINFFIDFEPLSYSGGKFNERPFKNNILKVKIFFYNKWVRT